MRLGDFLLVLVAIVHVFCSSRSELTELTKTDSFITSSCFKQ